MSGGDWVASTDEERWDCSGRHETRAQALETARSWETGGRVYTGRVEDAELSSLVDAVALADDVIERLALTAQDEHGDFAEGWPDASADDERDLASELRTLVLAWLARRGLAPTWRAVVDVEWHDPEPEVRRG